MTLEDYYRSLPAAPPPPKTALIQKIASECNVPIKTAISWVLGTRTPKNPEHVALISEIVNIPEGELFAK